MFNQFTNIDGAKLSISLTPKRAACEFFTLNDFTGLCPIRYKVLHLNKNNYMVLKVKQFSFYLLTYQC